MTTTEPTPEATPPMVEAMDAFDRFWNAHSRDGDWTTIGLACSNECGNCRVCGVGYALSWTHALLSNPALAEHAERHAAGRKGRS